MNIKAIVCDFSRVLIFAKADVPSLNRHHTELSAAPGYRVLEHFTLNTELLDYLRGLKAVLYLLTDGRLHALPEIEAQLAGVFRAIVTAEELGYQKSQSEAYLALAYRFGYAPGELLFIDDQQRNIEAASAAGLHVHRYTGNAELMHFLG